LSVFVQLCISVRTSFMFSCVYFLFWIIPFFWSRYAFALPLDICPCHRWFGWLVTKLPIASCS
jgi:hypothetical protein